MACAPLGALPVPVLDPVGWWPLPLFVTLVCAVLAVTEPPGAPRRRAVSVALVLSLGAWGTWGAWALLP